MYKDIVIRRKSIFESVTLLSLVLLVFQRVASLAGGAVADLGDYSGPDPYGVFMWITVHHLVQFVAASLAVTLIARRTGLDFCLGGGNRWKGVKYTLMFCALMLGYALLSNGIGWLSGNIQPAPYPLSAANVAGTLGFQLLLSGPGEELLFRALPIVMLSACSELSNKQIGMGRASLSHPTIIAAVLFALAHIDISFGPFSISCSGFQLVYAFAQGLLYGKVFERTGSVIYPTIMHSMGNFIVVGVGYLAQAVFV